MNREDEMIRGGTLCPANKGEPHCSGEVCDVA